VVGIPARAIRELSDEELAWLERSWRNYVDYKEKYLG
jgi:carbonic anhydrase/acetyltransferase-like protein (isoleucine patch superfamily)